MIYALISLVIFTSYIVFIAVKFGILKSVSASYYAMKERYGKNTADIVFAFVLWGFAVPVMIAGNSIFFFLAGSAICFVGAAPDYQIKNEGDVHYIAAVTGIVFSAIAIALTPLWWLSVVMVGIIIGINWIKNHTYWQELIAFYIVILYLFIK